MEIGQSNHIYNHANGRENIFLEEENYKFFLQKYAKYLGEVVDTYAYCLMPNHFHFLVGVRPDSNLSGFQNLTGLIKHPSKNPAIKGFTDFFNSYTKAINKRFERKGNLFIRAFKRTPILDERQWQETFLYIHLNPVKHGFVKDHQNWKWSSWHAYENFNKPSNLDRDYLTNFFDGWEHVRNMMEMKKEWLMNKNLE
ncbi:transposase [Cecembia calidifontis]|uniref:REP element-mobilizing transposase RayT n=1 Tax=Cecembia calidifontis TaxID=1187080 RepID=A0A4Q7P3Z7_9BACT|nr:transposase [Cecembia calidifontis]RZS94671.1 REP element-mobilizing transposase RayT [Cecembia calidifontis]